MNGAYFNSRKLKSQYQPQNPKRDILQFIPFKNYKDNLVNLARETLAKIPKQVFTFYLKRNEK